MALKDSLSRSHSPVLDQEMKIRAGWKFGYFLPSLKWQMDGKWMTLDIFEGLIFYGPMIAKMVLPLDPAYQLRDQNNY